MAKRDPARLKRAHGGMSAVLATGALEKPGFAPLSPAEGRRFGLTVGTAFLVIGGLLFWRGHQLPAAVACVLGVSLIAAAVLIAGRLGPVQRAWMRLAHAISRVTNPIVMAVMYYVVLTPAGFLRRRLGANPILHPPDDGSYWAPRSAERRRSDLQRQF